MGIRDFSFYVTFCCKRLIYSMMDWVTLNDSMSLRFYGRETSCFGLWSAAIGERKHGFGKVKQVVLLLKNRFFCGGNGECDDAEVRLSDIENFNVTPCNLFIVRRIPRKVTLSRIFQIKKPECRFNVISR